MIKSKYIDIVAVIFTGASLLLVINQVFYLNLLGITLVQNAYFYILMLLLLSLTFLLYPATSNRGIRWYDVALFGLTIISTGYLAFWSKTCLLEAWCFRAPLFASCVSFVLLILILESVRRTSGIPITVLLVMFIIYPLIAGFEHMPSYLSGQSYSLKGLVDFMTFSDEGILGIAFQTFAAILVGFLLFGAIMEYTGAGKTFQDISLSLLGRSAGGPAKVAVISSALMGSINGSVISNVATTGAITIPLMKSTGFKPHTAGAIEACSSTGAMLMPPVMGVLAFIMVAMTGISYRNVVIAAAIPSVLYYYSLFLFTSFYAGRHGLGGIKGALPSFFGTLKEGWFYFLAVIVLVYLLLYLRVEAFAPFYSALILLVLGVVKRRTGDLKKCFLSLSRTLVSLISIIAGVGIIMGSLSMTGMAQGLSIEIVMLSGENVYILLLLGAAASFLLGFGMPASAAYVFLGVTLAPTLIEFGLDPLGTHLYLIYWAMISFITPPVCLGAYAAAALAKSEPMKTGFEATKIGIAIYLLPFIFILEPNLLLQGKIQVWYFITLLLRVVIGLSLFVGANCNYFWGLRPFAPGIVGFVMRVSLATGGILLTLSATFQNLLPVGIILSGVGLGGWYLLNRRRVRGLTSAA